MTKRTKGGRTARKTPKSRRREDDSWPVSNPVPGLRPVARSVCRVFGGRWWLRNCDDACDLWTSVVVSPASTALVIDELRNVGLSRRQAELAAQDLLLHPESKAPSHGPGIDGEETPCQSWDYGLFEHAEDAWFLDHHDTPLCWGLRSKYGPVEPGLAPHAAPESGAGTAVWSASKPHHLGYPGPGKPASKSFRGRRASSGRLRPGHPAGGHPGYLVTGQPAA